VLEERGIEAEVGTISHVGGHKFAGNVIIYLPPGSEPEHTPGETKAEAEAEAEAEKGNKTINLKGTGLWYGRVGPEHVDGIVEETMTRGRIIADLFRGGISQKGDNLGQVLEQQLRGESGDEGALKLKPKSRAKKAN
jgi:hypothetical protein